MLNVLRRMRMLVIPFIGFALMLGVWKPCEAATGSPSYYDMGSPTLMDLWVDPVHGNDGNSGATRAQAVLTLAEAWNRIPRSSTLKTTGYRILMVAGEYTESALPNYMESRYGTYRFPIIIQAADGPLTTRFHGYLNIYDTRYLYLIGLNLVTDPGYGGGGDVIHIERGDHILIRSCRLDGFDGAENQPQETLKANQSQYLYVESSDISGAFWFALDYVAVQFGHILGNRIHNSGDDGVVLKGGTSYLRIEANEVYDCGVVGLTAGQGTGFEYMVSPWVHYEAYDLKFVNNIIHDTQNAGLAVRGGYNILMAYNTLYRIGINHGTGSALLLVSPGGRGCDGNAAACLARYNLGGWGPTVVGDSAEMIPNRNVYIYNNVFYNPVPSQTMWSHFAIFGPVTPPSNTNISSPVLSDVNLRIRGNLIWNGPADQPLGIEESDLGCQPPNTTCNATQLRSDNLINTIEPQLFSPAQGDSHPKFGGNVVTAKTFAIPDFQGNDRPQPPLSPAGDLQNAVNSDLDKILRKSTSPPGAYLPPNPNPPEELVKAVFIHHSTGQNWLADGNGNLGTALRDNHYFLSDTNYGWGPGSIGSYTDIGHWYNWFVGASHDSCLSALYAESGQNCAYSRAAGDPGGENKIILFKSCFPNSNLNGNPNDPPTVGANPLRGNDAGSSYMTVANAKGIYNDILNYFATRQDKLFIAIAAPPLAASATNAQRAANARAFNNWLVHDWLADYPYKNVAVFDFYNVLTSNGGNPNSTDAGSSAGNHHRWRDGGVQHLQTVNSNVAAYPSDASDSHPNAIGNQKATSEFAAFLNLSFNRWNSKGGQGEIPDFTANPTSGVAPLNVAFTEHCTGTVMSYLWDFGDGASSSLRNPSHTYTRPAKYSVHLTATYADGSQIAAKTDYIVVAAPFAFTSPSGSEVWNAGTNHVIRWIYNGNPGQYVKIDLYKGSVFHRTIAAKTSVGSKGSGSFAWDIPCEQLSGEDYLIRITSITNNAYYAGSRSFAIRGTSIAVLSPAGGEQWKAGESRRLQWSYTDCAGSYVKIELLKGGTPCLTISPRAGIGASGSGAFTWRIPTGTKPGTDYRVRITSTEYPAIGGVSSGNFTILAK